MKPEIKAATEFLSRIFLAHDNITQEKVGEFKQHLAALLEERFRDHWHEGCPTKGQAYRCIRVCPDEALDPLLEKVCIDVGICVEDFNLPFELTLWVDPTEVVCKFGDLKCSYHTVAKKDHNSGNLNNQTENLDIDDLVENARELYLKKQTVVVHPVHSSEMHVPGGTYSDGSSNGFTMAVRMNGTMHYNVSGSPPPGYDGSPRGKGKPSHSTHKRGGYHYYGKSSGGKGTYIVNGITNGGNTHVTSTHHGYPNHRNHHHHNQHGSSGHHPGQNVSTPYSNGYLNGYGEDVGYGFDQHSVSPTKMNGVSGLPPLTTTIGTGQISQSSPTPEQIQQQMQHPPPLPPSMPHLTQAFTHPDSTSMLPLPPLASQPPAPSSAATSSTTTTSNNSHSNSGKPTSSGSNSKYTGIIRGHTGTRTKQISPVKELK
jgi:hypothetical protein